MLTNRLTANMIKLALIGMVLALCIRPEPATAQNDSPYIYYFSDLDRAYIVERADGTDRRMFANVTLKNAEDNVSIDGPGWSPSRKWFAFNTLINSNGWYFQSKIANAVKVDGSAKLPISDLAFPHMAWAPTTDKLLVFSIDTWTELKKHQTQAQFKVFDLGTNETVFDQSITSFDPNFGVNSRVERQLADLRWIDDRYAVMLYQWAPVTGRKENGTSYLRVFDTVEKKASVIELDSDWIIDSTSYSSFKDVLSSKGDIIYQRESGIYIFNTLTRVEQRLEISPQKELKVHWSPDGSHAILGDSTTSLWTRSTNRVRTLSPFGFAAYVSNTDYSSVWSPDGSIALIPTISGLLKLDMRSGVAVELPYKILSDYPMVWEWTGSARALIGYNSPNNNISTSALCDFATDTCVNGNLQVKSYWYPGLSNNLKYAAWIEDSVNIINRLTGQNASFRPPERSLRAVYGGEVRFHPTDDWLFTFRAGLVAGGGNCCRHLGIIRADGAYQRDLSFVIGSGNKTTIDWLPAGVDISAIKPYVDARITPKPDMVLHGREWTGEIVWNPDGNQFVTLGGDFAPDNLYMWTLDQPNAVLLKKDVRGDVEWQPIDGEDYYEPVVTSTSTRKPKPYDLVEGQYIDGKGLPIDVVDVASGLTVCRFIDRYGRYDYDISPDRKLLVYNTTISPVQLWDLTTCKQIATLNAMSTAVSFSPNGEWLAVGSAWDVHLYRTSRFR